MCMKILDVQMTDVVGDYDIPGDISEWIWVENNASFEHVKNGKLDGIYEFMINVYLCTSDDGTGVRDSIGVPDTLYPLVKRAIDEGYSYILFHQGT